MALGIKITGGPLASEKLYNVTNARATELVDAFLSVWGDIVPAEMDTPAKVAQWKIEQVRIRTEEWFMQKVADGFDQGAAAEYQAIRDRNREKAKLGNGE